jgi:hypothetical protein
MGERMGRIGRIETDFLILGLERRHLNAKKSVSIRPIRKIRSPIVSLAARKKESQLIKRYRIFYAI